MLIFIACIFAAAFATALIAALAGFAALIWTDVKEARRRY